MKQKLAKIIKTDNRVAIAVDGGLPSIALLDLSYKILVENVVGIAVVTQNTNYATIEKLSKLKADYPLTVIKIDSDKLSDIDTVTESGKIKFLSIILQKVMHEANKKGFATVYSGMTADDLNSGKTEILNCFQIVAPFIEINAFEKDIKKEFLNLKD